VYFVFVKETRDQLVSLGEFRYYKWLLVAVFVFIWSLAADQSHEAPAQLWTLSPNMASEAFGIEAGSTGLATTVVIVFKPQSRANPRNYP